MTSITHGSIAEYEEREALKEHLAGLIVENKKLCEQVETMKATERCLNKKLCKTFEDLRALQSDPALEFCHRFAIVMECMVLSTRNDQYWTEATELISDYHEARNKWRESMGEPYVSGFGKD